jgi:hypothetical protein
MTREEKIQEILATVGFVAFLGAMYVALCVL